MKYNFQEIEKKWNTYWKKHKTFHIKENKKNKYYILNMFPYPSGSGLHVGHCLGYIASDIYARYKRGKGFNVLHPIGFDSFGLPAEQYAIQTGKNPKKTSYENEVRYQKQINNIGISFDWSRKLSTRNPLYYKWTQWMFIEIFNSWYDKNEDKAKSIGLLIKEFENNGNYLTKAYTSYIKKFDSKTWKKYNKYEKEKILQNYRLAFLFDSIVNWCPELNTVLANEEVNNGKSIRGGFSVYKKKMLQWNIRVSAYSKRLINGLNTIKCSKSLKKIQSNWIGKSKICTIIAEIANNNIKLEIPIYYPELIFGITFIVLSKNHFLSKKINSLCNKQTLINNNILYKKFLNTSSDIGILTDNYILHPITKKCIPIFISDFFYSKNELHVIKAGIPEHEKDSMFFSKIFNLETIPVLKVINKNEFCINSLFINKLNRYEARKKILKFIVEKQIGKIKTYYKLRDAIFSRQRYWGEPIPIYFKNKIPISIPKKKLPIILPVIKNYYPKDGKSALQRAKNWAWDETKKKIVSNNLIDYKNIFPIETSTMPSWAGSSWYFLRYMDVHNNKFFLDAKKEKYWKNVDLYIGGAEHGTGHLIYARFWNKFLKDRGWINEEEPFKKILNQGMILSYSAIILKVIGKRIFVSYELKEKKKDLFTYQEMYIDISFIKENNQLNIDKFKKYNNEFMHASFLMEKGVFLCKRKLEKMSKSKFNVINPDHIYYKYGSDVFRMYEMFLGPINQSKSWNEEKIIGVKNFINKFWKLYHINGNFNVCKDPPTFKEMQILHSFIKDIDNKIKKFSFNTCISSFMIIVNKLIKIKCNKEKILEPLVKLISPFAPYIAEELWNKLGKKKSIVYSYIPTYNSKYIEKKVKYIIMFNGKLKFIKNFNSKYSIDEIKNIVLNDYEIKNLLKKKKLKKLIIIPKKIINILY
ncbi:class I tRNA ligase family protein [Blattabacterium cuenoti]|uniref:class I tRNA ligase family protein n=1 Tax=Blattabacterium cuenoti TaxID=1653831 RepID=UPI00163BD0BE|nr:class I tRNA ligase family protein [Blattabacterium cuenoti]